MNKSDLIKQADSWCPGHRVWSPKGEGHAECSTKCLAGFAESQILKSQASLLDLWKACLYMVTWQDTMDAYDMDDGCDMTPEEETEYSIATDEVDNTIEVIRSILQRLGPQELIGLGVDPSSL